MKILAIDTVTEACSVAIINGNKNYQQIEIQPNAHSRLVLQMVEEVLLKTGISLENLDVIAVDIGPGSFTGVRIGLGVAQGLAYGMQLPVMGICSLEVLAASVESGVVFPAIDARINQIYCGLYEVVNNSAPVALHHPVVVGPESIPFPVDETAICLGSGWDVYAGQIQSSKNLNKINGIQDRYPEAKYVGEIALYRGLKSAINPLNLKASYIRNKIVHTPG